MVSLLALLATEACASVLTEACASVMTVGTHGTTYGGNPLAGAVAGELLSIVNTRKCSPASDSAISGL